MGAVNDLKVKSHLLTMQVSVVTVVRELVVPTLSWRSVMTPRRIRIKNWLALCFCQLERRPVSILAVNYLNPQGELFNENQT